MKLKLLTGATAPLICAISLMAWSLPATAVEKPVLTPEQQKKADEIYRDIMSGKTPDPSTVPQLTPEQKKQANQIYQDIMSGKTPQNVPQLTPEQKKQADKIYNDLMKDNNSDKGVGGLLTGDEKTACEVILCLSSGSRPSECNPPIRKYLRIRAKKTHETIRKRREFLKKCPNDDNDSSINSAIERIVNNEPVDCSAEALNQRFYWRGNKDADGDWYNSGIKLVPTTLAKQCGANWQAMVEYKCDEKQVPLWEEDNRGYSQPVRELVIDANGNRKWQTKMQTIRTNCRFVDRKGYDGSYYF